MVSWLADSEGETGSAVQCLARRQVDGRVNERSGGGRGSLNHLSIQR